LPGIAAGLLVDALKMANYNFLMNQGYKDCLAKAKKGQCCGCCVIGLYLDKAKYGEDPYIQLFSAGGAFFSKDCDKVKSEDEANAGKPSISPDFRRYETQWFTHKRFPLDDQYYFPQYQTVCP
jgi:hypothetical protein